MLKSICVLLTFISLQFTIVFAQNISNIVIDPSGIKMAYIKDSDSLFVKNLDSTSKEVFVSPGLKTNGNQRFISWTHDSENLVYEKETNLFKYNLKMDESSLLLDESESSLVFFRFYLINQVDISPDGFLYFSAGNTSIKNSEFQLYKLDLVSNKLEKLTNDSLGVSNISVSEDGKYTVYASYKTSGGWQSRVNVIENKSGKLIAKSDLYNSTFFNRLDWSPDNQKILARNVLGGQRIFNFNIKERSLKDIKFIQNPKQHILRFFNNDFVYELSYESEYKIYSLLNIKTGNRQKIVSDKNIALKEAISTGSLNGYAFFTKENRVLPIELSKIDITVNGAGKKIIVHSFNVENPLHGIKYIKYNYTNGSGAISDSYLYYPNDYDESTQEKHPLIIVSYGGFADNYPNFNYFLYENLFTYLRKKYIIAFVNTRGIGLERQETNYGALQLQDTELFVRNLNEDIKIDKDKIFVIGHSHGATMVYYFLTHSNFFAGGIAINGAADWAAQADLVSMEGLPGAMGGKPADIPEVYTQSSPIENIDNLKTPLLTITGALDTQIPANVNGLNFFSKSHSQNKNVKHIHFEDEGHLIEKNENKAILWNNIDQFLEEINLTMPHKK